MEAVTQQTDRKIVGEQQAIKYMTAEELVEGHLYFNNRLPKEKLVKILKKQENKVKIEVWNEFESKFKITTMDYNGFFRIINVPVYED